MSILTWPTKGLKTESNHENANNRKHESDRLREYKRVQTAFSTSEKGCFSSFRSFVFSVIRVFVIQFDL